MDDESGEPIADICLNVQGFAACDDQYRRSRPSAERTDLLTGLQTE